MLYCKRVPLHVHVESMVPLILCMDGREARGETPAKACVHMLETPLAGDREIPIPS